MRTLVSLVAVSSVALLGACAGPASREAVRPGSGSSFVDLLWLAHASGKAELLRPASVPGAKAAVAQVHRKENLEFEDVASLFDRAAFGRLAGDDGQLSRTEISEALEKGVPSSRSALTPSIASHAAKLTTSLERIAPRHREATDALVDWIVSSLSLIHI